MADAVDTLIRAASLLRDAFAQRAAEHGVSPVQTRMLQALRDRSPTINQLAELLGLDKSSTSGLVARAERHGLVRRVRSQLDRRSVRVRLTVAGREVVEAVSAQFAGDVAAMLEPLLDDERAALALYLDRAAAPGQPDFSDRL